MRRISHFPRLYVSETGAFHSAGTKGDTGNLVNVTDSTIVIGKMAPVSAAVIQVSIVEIT